MYNPPSNKNWTRKYPFSRDYADYYHKGWTEAENGLMYDEPFPSSPQTDEFNYWYIKGYEDFMCSARMK